MAPSTTSAAAPRVLVVDDDPLIRDMLETSLTRAGYRVTLAADGDAAIAALQRATPALILTDLFMPNRDGIELLRAAEPGAPRPPVIAMSGGFAGIDMLQASRSLGAAATIAKPFLPRELVQLVRRTLADPGTHAETRAPDAPDGAGGPAHGPGGAVANAGR
jgi:CheY-like chemotaxis protein